VKPLVVAFALAVAAPATAQSITPFSSAAPGGTPPRGWSALAFHNVERTTRYELVRDEGVTVVAAAADASASGWIFRLDVATESVPILRWRWKAEKLPADGDTRIKRGDDAVARVYVTFRLPPERVTLPQRLLDETARALYGEAPPHASLMYVWDTRAPAGTRMANPYTSRVHNVVVESGSARLGRWLSYERDLAADYRAAFGEDLPRLAGVAIMTDADNTGGTAAARYGDVSLSPR
jgi:hypothetical protein